MFFSSPHRSLHVVLRRPRFAVRSTEPSAESTQVKISAADVDQIQEELEVSSEEAKAALLKGSGDVVQALRHLLQ